MQKVSTAYRESMKSSLRERAYIMLSFGLINQEAQAKAKIGDGAFTRFTKTDNIFGKRTDTTTYATLEENFTKVDGSMFFLPRGTAVGGYYDTGLTSENLISEGNFSLVINLNIAATDFKGITIDFGENYPVDFDIASDHGQVVEFRDNTQSEVSTEEVFENTTSLTLTFYKMKNLKSRLRIYSIMFGYGLVYYNDSVMDSMLDSYVSPIGADIPQIDFTVTLKNYDKYFNVDNPRSAINFLETGQEMDVFYGYQLPNGGGVEWIKGNHLICSEWESDDYSATIRCQDVFRSMDTEYYHGAYNAAGTSYFNLAVEILQIAGISDYYLDPRLKNLYTKNPLPRVKCKEALQIIANACRCVLTQSRDGVVQIKSNFAPEASISSNGEAPYSKVSAVLTNDSKDEYATLATGYTVVDGGMFFLPRSLKRGLNTGFVSSAISGADGMFTTNPVLTVTQEAICMYYGVKLVFGNALPSGMVIRTYNTGNLVEEYTVDDEITKEMVIIHTFDDFDTMKVEFTGTAEPYNRIVLNSFAFGDVTNFTMTKGDMTSSPKAIKQEVVKEVIVPCYSYQTGNPEESLISEEVTVTAGEEMTFFLGAASYGYRTTLDEATSDKVSITASGNYYVTVKFTVAGTYQFEVWGYRYKVIERYATVKLHERGKTVKWENPLISDMTMASDLAEWIADYYSAGIEYEYNTRGNPEIDVNDIVYQENEFRDNMKVTIYRATLNFSQAFSGKITARRLEG